MKNFGIRAVAIMSLALQASAPASAETPANDRLQLMDVFQLEYASDPQVSPDGKQVVYVRNFMDVMKDRQRSHLWILNVDGTEHRPITSGEHNESEPRWSPDGKRLVYLCDAGGTSQLYCR